MPPNFQMHPLKLKELLWPHVTFYKQQREIIESVVDNDETVVPAGNMLGKDFVAGFIALTFFLARLAHPCRIITTSVSDDHLRVLWGEIGRFISESKYPLDSRKGGPLICNHHEIRKIYNGEEDKFSYLRGKTSERGEGLQGHHAPSTNKRTNPATLAIYDEASGVNQAAKQMCDTWAHRSLVIGNCWYCENFFKHAVLGNPATKDPGGDMPRIDAPGLYRKVIKIKGEDSPNVRYGMAQKAAGITPTDEIILPGVLSYGDYIKRRATLDEHTQCVSLDAEFYEGSEVRLYPSDWLDKAAEAANDLGDRARRAKTIGVDSAAGGDNSAWAVCDEFGLIELISIKTKDTMVIVDETIRLILHYKVEHKNVLFDDGGGGHQHVDQLRRMGYRVRAILFGGTATPPRKRGRITFEEKKHTDETRYVYRNRRCEMYGELRLRLDPSTNDPVFAIPGEEAELRRQLGPLPLLFDEVGRLYLPPKDKPKKTGVNESKVVTIKEMLGCSPDESDALVLAHFGMVERAMPVRIGAF